MLTEKEVKKYIKSCGVKHVQELFRSQDVINKLKLEGCSDLRTYHKTSLKIVIYYSYTTLINTPKAKINLRIYWDDKGDIKIIHWECGGIELLYDKQVLPCFNEEFYIWSEYKMSDFKTPWKYIEAMKTERENLEPLLSRSINSIGNILNDYLRFYTSEQIDSKKNNFIPTYLYSKMVINGTKYRIDFDEAIIPFIVNLAYDDCNYFKDSRLILDNFINNSLDRREIDDFIEEVWKNKSLRDKVKLKLIENFGNPDIAEKIIEIKLKEYEKELRSELMK